MAVVVDCQRAVCLNDLTAFCLVEARPWAVWNALSRAAIVLIVLLYNLLGEDYISKSDERKSGQIVIATTSASQTKETTREIDIQAL